VRNGNFAKKVAEADRFVRLLVEPGILATMPRPTIAVHLRNSSGPSLPWGFRAFQSNGVINVAQNEETSIIVHEVGHYIENNLPMERWHEIQMLLHARGGGAQNASYLFYPRNLEEQRFPGEYPATGQYTSKYYASGSTEVTSLSVEYLADPARFQRLIEADPQQAALVLRALRPTEFMMAAQKKTRGTLGWYADRYLPK
jgi:hypothetical protein